MLFIRYKCPNCNNTFKAFGLLTGPNDMRKCPKCGYKDAPLHEDDRDALIREESTREPG